MGSVGEKTPIELKLYLLSLALGILNHDKIDIVCIFHLLHG
jgi:hypothetical protein